jgi:hypothetical protein
MISVRERRLTKGDGSMAGRVNPHPGILLYTRIKKSPSAYPIVSAGPHAASSMICL